MTKDTPKNRATKDEKPQKITVNNAIFIAEIERLLKVEHRKSVTFVVRGYSMRPFLEDRRDKVVLVPPLTPKKGQVVLAEIKDKVYALHRIISIDADTITMQGDGNSLSQTETFTPDKIVGTAEAFIRKGKYVSTQSRKWRYYSALWQALRPMRRILLAIHRRIIKII